MVHGFDTGTDTIVDLLRLAHRSAREFGADVSLPHTVARIDISHPIVES